MMAAIMAGVPAFVLGVFVGACVGVVFMAMFFVAKRADSARPGGE